MSEVKERLVDFARELGFDSCRIAVAGPPAHADELRDWLNDGAHGEMDYMARGEEKRRDPQKVLPAAKSIIVLALNYFHSEPEWRLAGAKKPGLRGRIARYAWGDDYHDVI
jgi:epoxyqueuosine reductase